MFSAYLSLGLSFKSAVVSRSLEATFLARTFLARSPAFLLRMPPLIGPPNLALELRAPTCPPGRRMGPALRLPNYKSKRVWSVFVVFIFFYIFFIYYSFAMCVWLLLLIDSFAKKIILSWMVEAECNVYIRTYIWELRAFGDNNKTMHTNTWTVGKIVLFFWFVLVLLICVWPEQRK